MAHVIPNMIHRNKIATAALADGHLCWTCGSCDFECPVNNATNRLRPQKIVRMASLGMFDELLQLPELWYCVSCRRCWQVCPNSVKPARLIEYLRHESISTNIIPSEALARYRTLFARFQRIRWHVAALSLKAELTSISDRQWQDWLQKPVFPTSRTIKIRALSRRVAVFGGIHHNARTNACFTCGACSSACPVACEKSIFDPRTIFRMANLGQAEELLRSPSIWLCIACGRCIEACSQLVDGRGLIEALRVLALESGVVDSGFSYRLKQADRLIYARLLDEVDTVFKFHRYSHNCGIVDGMTHLANQTEKCATEVG